MMMVVVMDGMPLVRREIELVFSNYFVFKNVGLFHNAAFWVLMAVSMWCIVDFLRDLGFPVGKTPEI